MCRNMKYKGDKDLEVALSVSVVSTIKGRCRRCYSCVRHCPAKAIKVENDQALVMGELCIACGHCLQVCSQKAKRVTDDTVTAHSALASGRAVAALAPSFVAEFHSARPGQVIAALRRLGFKAVYEVAHGAELVTLEYRRLMESGRLPRGAISTACPAVVQLIEKKFPRLLDRLVPVVSPMIATGLAAKARYGGATPVIFIGPCLAKKEEARRSQVIEAALTFPEIRQLFHERKLTLEEMEDDSPDHPPVGLGRAFPIPGGLLKCASLRADLVENDILEVSGHTACLDLLSEMAAGRTDPAFVDMLFCEGCVNGPMMTANLTGYQKSKLVVNHVMKLSSEESLPERPAPGQKLAATFKRALDSRPEPTDEELRKILGGIGKVRPEDELNCGACGYDTCREKAVAVYYGMAENRMCLPFLISSLEEGMKELARLKDYSEKVLRSIAEGIVVIDSRCHVTSLSDPRGLLTRPEREGFTGRPFFEAFSHLDSDEVRAAIERTVVHGQTSTVAGIRYQADGSWLTVDMKVYPLRDGDSNDYGAVIVCEDVTEKRKLEAQLIARDKLASIGRLAAGVAHEINNPLSLISGYTELLRREVSDKPGAARHLEVMAEEVERMARIVRNLLDFSRPIPASVSNCSINKIIERVLGLVEGQLSVKGVRLVTDLAEELEVRADQRELEQVFLNIVINAIQAMSRGGILTVRTGSFREKGENGSGSESPSDRIVWTEISDTGCGIPEENLGRIFEPFFTTKEVGEGTGLGLSVSYGIIKKYGGTIEVCSEPGKGTTFLIKMAAANGHELP